ncbi:heavy metal-associated isoprenylated plant protein 41-like isoform X2 [Quercus lobata]|uniref:HMA domain-containing protein n=1 Tax=Quercus lobata TaxID=97700 RepID=A0A7N2M8Z3_QUELO|nr:heavy metal-associated isoprenylated plant protein 41-like isoform X2 [Quercus lobata]
MKQKIVMKVQMNCEKGRTKAMKIAAVAEGVISVAIEREKSLVVVIGDGVDLVSLAGSLRKKLGSATIESVQEVKAESAKKKDPIICYSQYPQYPMYICSGF